MNTPRAALSLRRSERIARRALGFALDTDLADLDAARSLLELSEGDPSLLRLARARILDATADGPVRRRAAEMISIAMSTVEAATSAPDGSGARPMPLVRRSHACIVLVGPPGAGKGTQGRRLAETLDIVHISTGDLLRTAADEESLVGFQARVFMDSGRLVPDDVVMAVLSTRLASIDVARRGCILDGVPRTENQARALNELLGLRPVDVVVELVVSETTTLERLQHRKRDDDSTSAIRQRFADYAAQTRPLLSWYEQQTAVWRIDGEQPPDVVAAEIVERFETHDHVRQDTAG